MTDDTDIWCEVSDDEMYNPGKETKGTWQPKPEDILRLFDELKTKKVLELHWTCPGRRPPDSEQEIEEPTKEEQVVTPVKQEEKKAVVPNEFDFDEDEPNQSKTVITPRRTPGSAPKSQKREARMDKILKDMMQQRKLQAAEREARKLAGAKSPRTPSSPSRARIGSPAGSPRTPNRQSPVRVGAGVSDTPTRGLPSEPPVPSRLIKTDQYVSPNTSKPEDLVVHSSQTSSVTSSLQSASVSMATSSSQPKEGTVSVSMGTNSSQLKEGTTSPNVTSAQQSVTSTGQTVDSKTDNKPTDSSSSGVEKMDTS